MTKAHLVEKDVKRKAKALLDKHGWFHWMPPANQFGKNGISDLHAVKPGVFMVVEFKKTAAEKPTEMQKAFLTMIHQAEHLAFVVNNDNLEDFERFLVLFDEVQAVLQKGGTLADYDMAKGEEFVQCHLKMMEPFAPFATMGKMAAAMPKH
jgi:hypothetical protein